MTTTVTPETETVSVAPFFVTAAVCSLIATFFWGFTFLFGFSGYGVAAFGWFLIAAVFTFCAVKAAKVVFNSRR